MRCAIFWASWSFSFTLNALSRARSERSVPIPMPPRALPLQMGGKMRVKSMHNQQSIHYRQHTVLQGLIDPLLFYVPAKKHETALDCAALVHCLFLLAFKYATAHP
jgi:hypothetical protein